MHVIWKMIFILSMVVGCAPTPEEQTSSIRISFPKSNYSARSVKHLRRALVAGSSYGVPEIVTLDDVDCYVVAIGFEKVNLPVSQAGQCGSGPDLMPNIQVVSATIPDGGEAVIEDVPVGPSRDFYVIAFATSLGTCPDFKSLQFSDLPNISRPMVVGYVNQGLAAQEENIVNITISMTGAYPVNSCQNDPFLWEKGGVFDAENFDTAVFAP